MSLELLISNICVTLIVLFILFYIAISVVAKAVNKKPTTIDSIKVLLIFAILIGAALPRLYQLLF